jgi:hypothetical protein
MNNKLFLLIAISLLCLISCTKKQEAQPELLEYAFQFRLYNNNTEYVVDSILISKNNQIPEHLKFTTHIEIPDSFNNLPVTAISKDGFKDIKTITSVSIPNSVTWIGIDAFYGCTGLTSITIPSSVTTIACPHLGGNPFAKMPNLESIHVEYGNTHYRIEGNSLIRNSDDRLVAGTKNSIISDSVTQIGHSAFKGSVGLTSIHIPDSVIWIHTDAFYGCTSLTSISIPHSVDYIGDLFDGGNPFASTPKLETIHVAADNKKFRSEGNNLIGNWDNTLISGTKNSIIPNSVEIIGWNAFRGCYGLTSITIPESVTDIKSNPFTNTPNLETIYVDPENKHYRSEGNSLIRNRHNILISGTKNSIIPDSVERIGNRAFQGCTGLTSITIPESVYSIGFWVFQGCTRLTSITFNNRFSQIGGYAFDGCISLTSINIPNGVRSISYNAFRDCISLTSITIPNSVTHIGKDAFRGCTSLTSISFPKSATNIDIFNILSYTPNLETINVDPENERYRSEGNNLIRNRDNSLISGTKNSIIPHGVTKIEWSAFEGCTSLISINIPDSVTIIDYRAFSGCTSLTSIHIPISVTKIGWGAFLGCSSLTIYAEAVSQPDGWEANWNIENIPVVWGATMP